MPSSRKTGHLLLNKWLGSDKPKKDDFNADNQIIDDSFVALQERIQGVTSLHQSDLTAVNGSLGQLSGRCDSLNISLSAHSSNTTAHLTAAERAEWNKAGPVMGTYLGDGATFRKISVGFQPRWGLIYAVGVPPAKVDWYSENMAVYSGFFGKSGCGKNLLLDTAGFTAFHSMIAPDDGCSYRYNEAGVTYVYVVWK